MKIFRLPLNSEYLSLEDIFFGKDTPMIQTNSPTQPHLYFSHSDSADVPSTESVNATWHGKHIFVLVDPKQKLIAQVCCGIIIALGIALMPAGFLFSGAIVALIGLIGLAIIDAKERALNEAMIPPLKSAYPILQNIDQLPVLSCEQRNQRVCYSIPHSLTSLQWMRGTDQAGQTMFIARILPQKRLLHLFPIKFEFIHSSCEFQVNQVPVQIQKVTKYFSLL